MNKIITIFIAPLMKTENSKMSLLRVVILILSFTNVSFSQNPNNTLNLGIFTSFAGYSGSGAVTNGGGATWTGDVGGNSGSVSGFSAPPFFNGNIYNADAVTAQCRIDLLRMFINLNDLFVNYPDTHAPAFGAGETLTPGVYSIGGAGSIGAVLNLNGGGNPNAYFIIKFFGAMTVGAGTVVNLTGGTQSCNVFFIADGSISVAANANIKGTLFSKVGAVGLGAGAVLEGRMFTLEGAIGTGANAVVGRPAGTCTIPVFCENGCNAAPVVDVLGSLSDIALYTNLGVVSNTSTSGIIGNIGANTGSVGGFISSVVIGSYHTADAITSQAQIDLDNAYISLMALPNTVPSDLGVLPIVLIPHGPNLGSVATGGETITAGVYFINSSGSIGGKLILDAQNNPDALFVFKFAGALAVASQAKMILINGARRCNVFFIGGTGIPTGAISIGAGAVLKGTFLSHNGACGSGASLFLAGRQLSTSGAITAYSGIIYNNPECITSSIIPIPLPIELVSFTGECLPNQNRLNWETATETNNDYFSIDRSDDGINWSEIGKISGAGNSSSSRKYFFEDENRYQEISYYRLQQHDFSGVVKTFSPISVQNCIAGNNALSIYPNPAKDAININFNGNIEQVTNSEIYDLFGKNLYQSSIYQSVINIENFQDGIYFLQLMLKSGNVTRKFIIAR